MMGSLFLKDHIHRNLLSRNYKDSIGNLTLNEKFQVSGFVLLKNLFRKEVFECLADDCDNIFEYCHHKNFTMPGYQTPRKMSIAGGKMIAKKSDFIPYLYIHYEICSFLSKVVGSDIFTIKHQEECFVANYLKAKGETHGWHLDDPKYALIVVIESPGNNNGGCVEIIKNWKRLCRKLKIDPHGDINKGVEYAKKKNLIDTHALNTGDCYLLDAGENLHRVTPITKKNAQRKVLNLAYNHKSDITFGKTADILYAHETLTHE